LRRAAATFVTFHFVCFAWIFFRSNSFVGASRMLAQLATLSTFHPNLPAPLLAVLGVGLASHFIPEDWYLGIRDGFVRLPALVQGVALFGTAVLLRQIESADAVPFVYFQF
jgi:alginate O-acetyltransferase complex protein AlgI